MTTLYTGNYNFNIKSVEKNGVVVSENTPLVYEDSIISIYWKPGRTHFSFDLKNKSNKNFQILWDEAAMVCDNGGSKRIFHSGVKYNESEKSQPPTTIIKGTNLSDLILPAENVSFIHDPKTDSYDWREKNIFSSSSDRNKQIVENDCNKFIGENVIISIPIKQSDKTIEYVFNFTIKGTDLTESKVVNPKGTKAFALGIIGACVVLAIVLSN